jgi:hypothetical protein
MGQLTVMRSTKKKPRQRKLFVSGHMSNYHAGKLQQQKNNVSC